MATGRAAGSKKPAKKTVSKSSAATPVKKPAPNTKAPAGSYALPGGGPGGADAYPVNTKARGANALSRVAANGTPAEKAKVRAAVKSKYPDLPSSQGKGTSQAADSTGKKKKTTAAKPRARKS
jgi:hypothetical protein